MDRRQLEEIQRGVCIKCKVVKEGLAWFTDGGKTIRDGYYCLDCKIARLANSTYTQVQRVMEHQDVARVNQYRVQIPHSHVAVSLNPEDFYKCLLAWNIHAKVTIEWPYACISREV